jgi:hypothetical protein
MNEFQQKGLNLFNMRAKKIFFYVYYTLYYENIIFLARSFKLYYDLDSLSFTDFFSMICSFQSVLLLVFTTFLLLYSATNIIIFYLLYIFFHLARTDLFFFYFSFLIISQRLCFKLRVFSKGSRKHKELINLWYKT